MDYTKEMVLAVIGMAGGCLSSAFGGWNSGLSTLVLFMAVDYITGLIVAGVFHKSEKSTSGSLESNAGFKGICKKIVMLLCVLVGYRLDVTLGTNIIKDGVIIAFIANEALSIMENAGLMGVPIPKNITQAIEVLKDKSEGKK